MQVVEKSQAVPVHLLDSGLHGGKTMIDNANAWGVCPVFSEAMKANKAGVGFELVVETVFSAWGSASCGPAVGLDGLRMTGVEHCAAWRTERCFCACFSGGPKSTGA